MVRRNKDRKYQLPEFNPNATAEWILNQSNLPWLPLSIEIPHDMIQREIPNILHLIKQHRERDYTRCENNLHDEKQADNLGWYSFVIHGKSYDATREDSFYDDERPHIWTPEACELMPGTVEYFNKVWPGVKYRRLRVMILTPGGVITPHIDAPVTGDRCGLRAVNIAITQPKDCDFALDQYGVVPFESGRAIMVDTSKLHTVVNDSMLPRWHLIVHADVDYAPFKELVVKSYLDMYNN